MPTRNLVIVCVTILLMAAMILCGFAQYIKTDAPALQKRTEELERSRDAFRSYFEEACREATRWKTQHENMVKAIEAHFGPLERPLDEWLNRGKK